MPPKNIKTVRDLIYWEYSKLIAGSAVKDRKNYGFVMHTFERLKEQKKFTKEERVNKLVPVVTSGNTKDGNTLHIHQDANFYLSTLTAGGQIEHKLSNERKAYMFVIDGEIKLKNNKMLTRDAAMIENENELTIKAEKSTEIILIDLPEKYSVNT